MLECGVAALMTLIAVVSAGPLSRYPRESEDYQAMDAYTNFTANEVCFSDNQVFQKGDLVPNPGPCEECRCEPPSIVCNMVKCPVNNNGCRTIQRPNQCCPEYICECDYNGRTINDGARIDTPEEPCQVCYCKGGDIMCNSVTCYTRDDCSPIVVPGQCCPKYENCPIREGVADKNGGSNKTANHGNNNKDMQPWLLTKTMQPHSPSASKAPEPAALVTTENGDAVIVSDWLTERKLMTEDGSGSITRHAILTAPTGKPGSKRGSTTPPPPRDGNGAVVKTGETVRPVEEVIFTRVDMLKDSHGFENPVTTISPVILANTYTENSSTKPIEEATVTSTLGSIEQTTIPVYNKSETSIENKTEQYLNKFGNMHKEVNVADIFTTNEPYVEVTTGTFTAKDLFLDNGEEFIESTSYYDSHEYSTFYPTVDSKFQETEESFMKKVVEPDHLVGGVLIKSTSEIHKTQQSARPATEVLLGNTVTTEEYVYSNVLETTTSQPLDTNQPYGENYSSMNSKSGTEINGEKDVDGITEYPATTEEIVSDTEELEDALSKTFDPIKPIKVKQGTVLHGISYTTKIPITIREDHTSDESVSSVDSSELSQEKDRANIDHNSHSKENASETINGSILEKNVVANNDQSKYIEPKATVEEVNSETNNFNNNSLLSNSSSHLADKATSDSPPSTDISNESVTDYNSWQDTEEALLKVSDSVTEDNGNAPPVIDLNSAMPFLQLGGPVLSESVLDEIGDLRTTASTIKEDFGKPGEIDNPTSTHKSVNYSDSISDKSTETTVTIGLESTPTPLLPSDLNTNIDKKSFKIESSKEIISTHIPLTPGDLKAIAEYLINKKIKPASNENDTEYSTNKWLKGNLTSEEKITSILSAANISIGIMNYTELPKNNPKSTSSSVKVEKYEKDDIFKGNSILSNGNSLVNKTGNLHDKYVESSTKSHERTENNQYSESKLNILQSTDPTAQSTKLSQNNGSTTVSYTTVDSLSNLLSTQNNLHTSENIKVTRPTTEIHIFSSDVIDLKGNTSHKSNDTQVKVEKKNNGTTDSTNDQSGGSSFSLTRFISSFFSEEDLPSTGIQKPLIL